MITEITIQNYRSIWDATVELRPFTLLIGANGTGKSNFLALLRTLGIYSINGGVKHSDWFENKNTIQRKDDYKVKLLTKHINHLDSPQTIFFQTTIADPSWVTLLENKKLTLVRVFSVDPSCIGKAEKLTLNPTVGEDGSGAVQVLDSLKTGDREDLFKKIESSLKKYIQEIEKLSFVPLENAKKLQVRERHISKPVLLSELSEGTRLILTILTIIYQENPPKVICLEDIDKGLHPRLFQKLIDLCFEITEEKDIQIIATTHNPYLVNKFYGHEDAVIIVEKENGETKFTTLEERLEGLNVQEEDPLGELWYSGFVGGVPERRRPVR